MRLKQSVQLRLDSQQFVAARYLTSSEEIHRPHGKEKAIYPQIADVGVTTEERRHGKRCNAPDFEETI